MSTPYLDPAVRRQPVTRAHRVSAAGMLDADWSGWSPERFLGVLAAVSSGTVAGRTGRAAAVPAR